MPSGRLQDPAVRAATVAVALGAVLAVGLLAGAALADDHTREEAPHYGPDDAGNATFEFLEQEGHYPGAQAVSVRYTMKGGAVYEDVGATDGVAADWFVVETDAVDHSDCDTENVAVFGIDRGDNSSDGSYDQDLVRHARAAYYFDDGIVIEFYDYEDFGGDPPVIHAEDRIVLELSDESSGGACADTTTEKGWYTVETFLNGTGPREENRSDERYGFTIDSEHNYVCFCDDEEEARERLGPPPATPTETPGGTPTGTDTATPTPTERPRTPTPDGTPILTATVNESVGNASVSGNASVGEDGGSADVSVRAEGGPAAAAAELPSPTPADAPGFGELVAAATLLGTALLARRRAT